MYPSTIWRWVQRFVPEFEKRWDRLRKPVGCSWRMDETYVQIRGRWCYLYRAVDKQGRTIDWAETAAGRAHGKENPRALLRDRSCDQTHGFSPRQLPTDHDHDGGLVPIRECQSDQASHQPSLAAVYVASP
jgi:hypothetical protein